MNVIGKILPIEGYYVLLKGNLPVDYTKSLIHLYQPLIGIQSVSLYQTLLHEKELQQGEMNQTHHTLMNYLNLPLDDIYRARLKLEGIGLLATFQNQTEEYNAYTYELQCPFAPAAFFTDEMLTQLLYHHIGETKYKLLKEHYYAQTVKQKGTNITSSFNEVFQTFQPNKEEGVEMMDGQKESTGNLPMMDFSWVEQALTRQMIPIKKVLTPTNKKLVTQMMVLYDLTSLEVEKSVLWALTDENTLNRDEFKEACHDLYKNKHNQVNVRLTDRVDQPTKEVESKPTTKEEQFISELEKISPKQLLEDLSNGGQASGQDMKVIRDVMTTQGLPSPVMNVLIHYVLLQSNMKLSRAYLEKIASHWSRANLKTAKEAMAFAKKEKDRFQQGKKDNQRYKKPQSNEVVPDWFKERKEKKQKTSQKNTATETNNDEFAALLKEFSNGNKNNHLQG